MHSRQSRFELAEKCYKAEVTERFGVFWFGFLSVEFCIEHLGLGNRLRRG